jgi:hypothetical protein
LDGRKTRGNDVKQCDDRRHRPIIAFDYPHSTLAERNQVTSHWIENPSLLGGTERAGAHTTMIVPGA